TAAALGGMAAMAVTTTVRLISSDSSRNFYVPFVLLMPYAAHLLATDGERCRRALPGASSVVLRTLLAAVFAWHCGGMANENGWCFPGDNGASRDGCRAGSALRSIVERGGGRRKSMSCRAPSDDFSCVSATVCSGLEGLAEGSAPPAPSDAFYRIEPCAAGRGSMLARTGQKCLYQRIAPRR
ncbi:MAG: hypothetical protein ACHQ2Z_16415, partial [Elusimicrobiota bacterium]